MKPNLFLTIIAIIVGYLISAPIAIYIYGFPFFAIVPGIIIACNITRDRKFFVCVSIGVLIVATEIVLLFLVPIDNYEYKKQVAIFCLESFILAVVLGYGYSKSGPANKPDDD